MVLHAADEGEVRQVMLRATHYMMDKAAYRDGFVWSYLPDYSRRWGELEASPTMVWLQSPSTPDMGELMLDAYHATGDEYYYDCAGRIARCLMAGQLPCGGWNYLIDFGTETETRQWYATIGRQAWRLEEFQHYYGNATFDDEATANSAQFLLRYYMERKDDRQVYDAIMRAIDFMLDSQYANGGWPQRYPLKTDHPFNGKADYTPFVTLNDNVTPENIRFLANCYGMLGIKRVKEPVLRAMHLLRDLQQPLPLAGWADQYTPDELQPAHARSYEPRSINTGTTVSMFNKMLRYYEMTGDTSYLQRLPEAIQFLESMKLPASLASEVRRTPLQEGEILLPRFIVPETGRPLYVHRKGGNVKNGTYYTDEDPHGTIAHYSSFMVCNPENMRQRLKEVRQLNQKDLARNQFFDNTPSHYPAYHYDLARFAGRGPMLPTTEQIIKTLNKEGYWLTPLRQVSNPFKPIPQEMASESDSREYTSTMVGDEYDTSPFTDESVKGISTQVFIRNMAILIQELRPDETTLSGLHHEAFEGLTTGKPTALYTLHNANGMEACITNYGARLVSLMVPDRDGKMEDVVLGFDNIADYHHYRQNYGATVGRYIGRIKGARITLDGKEYSLQQTGGGNISHGGYPGFADQVWNLVTHTDSTLTLRYLSSDGENGFPGQLTVDLTYTLNNDNSLILRYRATTDKTTVVNLSNHSFFNLSGQLDQSIEEELLWVDSKQIATYDTDKNLNGHFRKTDKRRDPFCFKKPKRIGQDIDRDDAQLKVTRGYDHSFVLSKRARQGGCAAIVTDPGSGRIMRVHTTEPVVHIYTANGLKGTPTGKHGISYPRRSAICLETMHLADSPHHPEWPSTELRPDEVYQSETRFSFDTF
jgi:PelA/Pel-15E family pectate lyase